MNLNITHFQFRIFNYLDEHLGFNMTTYELSRRMKEDFWDVQQACKTLYQKGFLDNTNRRWSIAERTEFNSLLECLNPPTYY